MNTLTEIKNAYAVEHAYKDWKELQEYHKYNPRGIEEHMNEICIRAQKAALEKAAENGLVRLNFNNLGDNNSISEKRFKIRDTSGFYDIDSYSITNPENLIR